MEVEGKMPEDKGKCLDVINKYLSLPDEERLNFRLGRRAGYYTPLTDLGDSHKHDKIEQAIKRLKEQGSNVEEVVFKLKDSFL
jgi:Asp-tRNA(Asn)/Glu-tRNA(Gln) amidotransferase A subunit family amidase